MPSRRGNWHSGPDREHVHPQVARANLHRQLAGLADGAPAPATMEATGRSTPRSKRRGDGHREKICTGYMDDAEDCGCAV